MSDFNWKSVLGKLAPTAASLLLGPFAGMAVSALGDALGIDEPTQAKIETAFKSNALTAEQLMAVKLAEQNLALKLEELGVKREDIAASDRNSARTNNVAGGTQNKLFFLSVLLLGTTLGCEVWVLFNGYPAHIPEIVVGRILGLMDSIAAAVLAYWFGTTAGSADKTHLLANSTPK